MSAKVSRTVLQTSRGGDPPAEFSAVAERDVRGRISELRLKGGTSGRIDDGIEDQSWG
jgi:hypothetical protein